MPNSILFYNISRWLYLHKIPLLPSFFRGLIFILYNCKIPYQSKIGKGTFLICKGIGVSIIENAEIGENCRIGINVVIAGKSPYKNSPKLGNNIWLGPGSIILGPVIIEDDVIISANSVILKSIPSGAIVAGVPAKIIGWTKDLNYDIMKNESWRDGYIEFLNIN